MKNSPYALAGILAPLIFVATYLTLANSRPEYSFLTKAVSELGSVDAPNKWTWNVLGYIVPGLLIAFHAVGLFRSVSNGQSSKLPLVGLMLSGLFMAFSGVFPGDFDNKQSVTMLLHTIGSFGSYVFFLVAAFTYPRQMRKSTFWASSVTPTLAFTWMTILFGGWAFVFPRMPAVGQRFVFLFYFCWILHTALKMRRQAPTMSPTID